MIRQSLLGAVCVLATLIFSAADAEAIPVFAHRYGLSCQVCHTTVPHLNAFGEDFLAGGYALPGAKPGPVFPLAIKVNLAYSSEPTGSSLPKAVVDEVELLTGGHIGKAGSYFAEVYAIDGGHVGSVRDAWYAQRFAELEVTGGQFTLPLPVDPETFRETSAHYALYDQTVGANPFNFFDPKQGLSIRFGSEKNGFSVSALGGHDKQSGLASHGIDRMLAAQTARGAFSASVYRYDGARALDAGNDRFWRQGIGLGYTAERLHIDATLQTGNDVGLGIRSSGGFVQARFAFTPALAAIVRYDGTQDAKFARTLLIGASRRVSRNARFTLEDLIAHGAKHTLNAAYLFAY